MSFISALAAQIGQSTVTHSKDGAILRVRTSKIPQSIQDSINRNMGKGRSSSEAVSDSSASKARSDAVSVKS